MTHICVSKLTIIGSDNGLSPGRRQAIIWTNDGLLLIGPLGTNFSEILSKIHTFSFRKMHLKTSSAKWRPFCLGLNVIIDTVSYHLLLGYISSYLQFPGCVYIIKRQFIFILIRGSYFITRIKFHTPTCFAWKARQFSEHWILCIPAT